MISCGLKGVWEANQNIISKRSAKFMPQHTVLNNNFLYGKHTLERKSSNKIKFIFSSVRKPSAQFVETVGLDMTGSLRVMF